jgi:hypothetical protein
VDCLCIRVVSGVAGPDRARDDVASGSGADERRCADALSLMAGGREVSGGLSFREDNDSAIGE